MKRTNRNVTSRLSLSLALIFSAVALAQSPARPRASVTYTMVKPDMVTEWTDLQKNEVVPALKKAGVKSRAVYRNAPFNGSPYQYVTIQPIENYGQYDGESAIFRALGREAGLRLAAKLRRCVDSTTTFVSTGWPELSNPRPPDQAPKIIAITRYRVAPGKAQEYENFLKTEILPVYKKNNVYFTVSQRGFGSNAGEWTTSVAYDKYGDLESGLPLGRILGAEGAAKVIAKAAPIRTQIQTMVRTYVPDLSFR